MSIELCGRIPTIKIRNLKFEARIIFEFRVSDFMLVIVGSLCSTLRFSLSPLLQKAQHLKFEARTISNFEFQMSCLISGVQGVAQRLRKSVSHFKFYPAVFLSSFYRAIIAYWLAFTKGLNIKTLTINTHSDQIVKCGTCPLF